MTVLAKIPVTHRYKHGAQKELEPQPPARLDPPRDLRVSISTTFSYLSSRLHPKFWWAALRSLCQSLVWDLLNPLSTHLVEREEEQDV